MEWIIQMTEWQPNSYYLSRRCFIIAEAGINHNGCLNRALQMIEVAAKAGADAIKFQTFKTENLVTENAATATYQQNNTGHKNQYEMLKKLELKDSDYPILVQACEKNKIEFMSTPFDNEALEMLIALGMKYIKIPSGELTNLPFLKQAASKNLPLILSTGMATLDEIKDAVQTIREERKNKQFNEPLEKILTILHCTSNYPCPPEEANLRAIQTIRDTFSLPVGYSDHTLGTTSAPICLGLGITVYEKHFTLDTTLPGPDHCASLNPEELKEVIEIIRHAEIALGNSEKIPTDSELVIRKIVRKSIAWKENKKIGQIISEADVHFLRPGTGIEPKNLDKIIGRSLLTDVTKNELINWIEFE